MLFALMLFGNPPNKAYHQRTADILIKNIEVTLKLKHLEHQQQFRDNHSTVL